MLSMNTCKRIVVVDDDPKTRLLLKHILQPPEFEAHLFSNGPEALLHLPEIQPDCLVSDFIMPGMDGEALLREARDIPGLESVPFIVISALRSGDRIRSVLDAGATAFLQKPFPLRHLADKIRSVLGEATAPPEASPVLVPLPPAPPPPPPAVTHSPDDTQPLYETILLQVNESGRAQAAESGQGPLATEASPTPPTQDIEERDEPEPPDSIGGLGRFTRVEWNQRAFVVVTEYAARPRFTVTTVISENGTSLRKFESSLTYPLGREEDRAMARHLAELQHEEVLQRFGSLVTVALPRRALWPEHRRSVDPALLAWTMSAIARRAEEDVGTELTARLLRVTRAQTGDDALRGFDVTRFGRVVVDQIHSPRLPRHAVDAVARWCSAFAEEAFHEAGDGAIESIREATRPRASELESLNFYDKLSERLSTAH